MFFHIPYYHPPRYFREKKIWVKVRFLHETEKAVLVLHEGKKIWIAKSRIYKIRLRKNVFEIRVRKSMLK